MSKHKFPSTSECKFGNVNKICSPPNVIESMKKLIEQLSNENAEEILRYNISDENVINKAKKLLNCKSESCIIASNEFSNLVGKNKANAIKNAIFKPSGPWKDNAWLSNVNIDEVLDQWSDIYPGYNHIPFKMNDTIKNVKINSICKNSMKCFSIAINTDKSSGPGIHWFCIYGDFDNHNEKRTLEYFNSSGAKPSREVHEWIHETKHNSEKELGGETEIVLVNKNDLQKGTSECGIFVLWYIYSRLNDVPPEFFNESESADDEKMFQLRRHLFRRNK